VTSSCGSCARQCGATQRCCPGGGPCIGASQVCP
jgi:hypothetical protein